MHTLGGFRAHACASLPIFAAIQLHSNLLCCVMISYPLAPGWTAGGEFLQQCTRNMKQQLKRSSWSSWLPSITRNSLTFAAASFSSSVLCTLFALYSTPVFTSVYQVRISTALVTCRKNTSRSHYRSTLNKLSSLPASKVR